MATPWPGSTSQDEFDTTDDEARTASRLSPLLYTILPSLVQARIPRLRSTIKRALSNYDGTTYRNLPPSRTQNRDSLDSITPPPSYQSNVEELEITEEQPTVFAILQPGPSRPSSSGSATPTYPAESASGIQWRYADLGFASLSLSHSDASGYSRTPHFVRRQYVDGVACVLRGLPADLTAEEELILREALPTNLAAVDESEQQVTIRSSLREQQRQSSVPARRQSQLHRWVAAVTLFVFLVFSTIVPYVQLFLRRAYQFDRKHKISDRALAQGMIAADAMSRRTFTIATQVCAMNDGKVGESMKEVGMYFVQGLSGGVYDGLGEGMQVIGLRAKNQQQQQQHTTATVERGDLGRRPQSSQF